MIPDKPIRKYHDNELDETWLVGLKHPFDIRPYRRCTSCCKSAIRTREYYYRKKNGTKNTVAG